MMKPEAQIPKPCDVQWESMKIGVNSRFCVNCSKNVIDFTSSSRREILEYLLLNYNSQVCGRIKRTQMDFSHEELLVTIRALSAKHKNSNLAFYLLTIGSLVLAACDSETGAGNSKAVNKSKGITLPAPAGSSAGQHVSIPVQPEIVQEPFFSGGDAILGEVILSPETTPPGQDAPLRLVSSMPEFPGGMDSLENFMRKNLRYPEWERKQKIEGTVYVSFLVDRYGKIKDPVIIHGVAGSRDFEREVLRVVRQMPDWCPGDHYGEKVDVQFNLPVRFKL